MEGVGGELLNRRRSGSIVCGGSVFSRWFLRSARGVCRGPTLGVLDDVRALKLEGRKRRAMEYCILFLFPNLWRCLLLPMMLST